MFIFCPYHAFSSKAQGLIQVQFTKIVYLTPKVKYTIHQFANTTSIIYIISHAYNMLIHDKKYLPRLGICWSCPRSPKELFALGFGKERNVWENIQKWWEVLMLKIWSWDLYIDPKSSLAFSLAINVVKVEEWVFLPLWANSFISFWA